MTASKFYDSCVMLIEKELSLDSSNEKEKIIDKFMKDNNFQIEILKKCNFPPLPNMMTQGIIASLICKYSQH